MALKSLEDSLSQHILQPLFTEMDISTSEREESTPKKLGKIVNKKWKKKKTKRDGITMKVIFSAL